MNNLIKFSISTLILGASLTASATDYYLVRPNWGNADEKWTPTRTEVSTTDNLFIDFQQRVADQPASATYKSWNISYYLTATDTASVANSLTFQNLYNSNGASVDTVIEAKNTGTNGYFEVKDNININLSTDYVTKVTWKNATDASATMKEIKVGNAINIGSNVATTPAEAYINFGIRDKHIEKVSVKDINVYEKSTFNVYATTLNATGTINIGDGSKLLARGTTFNAGNINISGTGSLSLGFGIDTATAAKQAIKNVKVGVITMTPTENSTSLPSLYLTNENTLTNHSASWNIKGISGNGSISTYAGETGNKAYIALAVNSGEEYNYIGALKNVEILTAGAEHKGTQYLRGNNTNIGSVSIRSGTLYLNGKNMSGTYISFTNNIGKLGIVSEYSDYGVLNINTLALNNKAVLLLDISDAQQDTVNATSQISISGAFAIDFTLSDDVVLGKEYKIFTTEKLKHNNYIDDIITTNNKGYNTSFVLGADNKSLSVIFSVAVPEPAE